MYCDAATPTDTHLEGSVCGHLVLPRLVIILLLLLLIALPLLWEGLLLPLGGGAGVVGALIGGVGVVGGGLMGDGG